MAVRHQANQHRLLRVGWGERVAYGGDPRSPGGAGGRARVAPEVVGQLVELGILGAGPYGPGDVRRVRLVDACEQAGLSLEGIGAAIADGRLSLAFLDLLTLAGRSLTGTTYAQLCGQEGLPIELVQRVHEASGLGRPRPEDPIHPLDRDLLGRPAGQDAGAGRRGADPDRAGVRGEPAPDRPGGAGVLPRPRRGAAAGLGHERAADAGDGHPDERPAGRGGAADAAGHLHPPPGALHHRPPGRAHRGGGDRAAAATTAGHVLPRPGRLHPAHRGAGRPGGGGAGHQPGRPGRAGVASPRRPAGQVARRRGHVPLQAARPGGGGGAGDGGADPAGRPAPAHVGLHAGPVVFQDGDYFGRTVNLAARIAGHAGPGEVLVSDEVVAECARRRGRLRADRRGAAQGRGRPGAAAPGRPPDG